MQVISGEAVVYGCGGDGASYSYNYYAAGEYSYEHSTHYDYPHYHYYDSPSTYSTAANYYAYEQLPSLTRYTESYNQTHPMISYSVYEFNETDFEEYDPTPYGGGYDLAQTYGSPLPHSDDTCYPRSTAGSIRPAAVGPIAAPQIEIPKPAAPKIEESKPIPAPQVEIPQPDAPKIEESKPIPAPRVEILQPDAPEIEESKPMEKEEGVEEEEGNVYGYGGGKSGRVPSGYGLETVDLCESLFGYWPCLEKCRRESDGCGKEGGDYFGGREWDETAADYLFGSSYDPYAGGEGVDDGWGYRRREQCYYDKHTNQTSH